MEMANRAGSGLFSPIRAGGTGMYVLTLEWRDCFWSPCSGIGAWLEWMLTAMPLKHGMVAAGVGQAPSAWRWRARSVASTLCRWVL